MNRLKLLCLVGLVLLAACSRAPESFTVEFEDANLAAAVRHQLGLAENADISSEALADLNTLVANGQGIKSLEGLQHAHNLKELDLGLNDISDLDPLSGLKELQMLRLYGNDVTELSALSELTNLTQLHLNANRIQSLSPLKDLINLQVLSVAGNSVISLAPLQQMKQLEALDAGANNIRELEPIAALSSLTQLHVDLNFISDISVVLTNESLRHGKMLSVRRNCLDLSDGSATIAVVRQLEGTIEQLRFEPQREC